NWTINKTGGTVNLATDLVLTSGTSNAETLTLTKGTITTNTHKMFVGSTVILNSGNGFIVGTLQREFSSTGQNTFPVGTVNGSSPVDVNVTTLTTNLSSLSVSATQTNHPLLNPNISLKRF